MYKIPIIIGIFLLFFTFSAFANGEGRERQELFFVAPLVETIGYSDKTLAFGGGLSIGSGSGTAFGMRLLLAANPENFTFVEILFFMRLYIFGTNADTGPFVQINGGPVMYSDGRPEHSGFGNISAGLSGGWRFPLGESFFIEPAARVGFPYIAGIGVSSGYRY